MSKKIVITESEITVEREKCNGTSFSWDDISKIRKQVFGEKVEGFTIAEYAEKYGMSPGRAGKDIYKLQRLGHIRKTGTRPGNRTHSYLAVYATVTGGKNGHGDVSSSSNGRRR